MCFEDFLARIVEKYSGIVYNRIMKLLMDVGNTNIKIGLMDDDGVVETFRIATDHKKTADEYGMLLYDLLKTTGHVFSDVDGIIISSVAPTLNYTLEHMCNYYMGIKPIMVNADIKMPVKIDYDKRADLGSDRILNAVAAYVGYGGPVITVDFGTTTTYGVVDRDGTFIGGAIAPGIKSSAEALVNTAAKLPRFELTKPAKVVNKTTIGNMQAGVIYGFIGLVEYTVKKIKDETGFFDAKVVATGGMSQIIVEGGSEVFDVVDRALSLNGLKILLEYNR